MTTAERIAHILAVWTALAIASAFASLALDESWLRCLGICYAAKIVIEVGMDDK